MALKFGGLRTCIYRVPDLETAKDWYAQVFATSPYFDEPFYKGFSIAGYELGLLPIDRATGQGTHEDAQGEPAEPSKNQAATSKAKADNIMTYWAVEDIEAAKAHFLEQGAGLYHEPMHVGGGIWTLEVVDPWGNLVGLIQNPHFDQNSTG